MSGGLRRVRTLYKHLERMAWTEKKHLAKLASTSMWISTLGLYGLAWAGESSKSRLLVSPSQCSHENLVLINEDFVEERILFSDDNSHRTTRRSSAFRTLTVRDKSCMRSDLRHRVMYAGYRSVFLARDSKSRVEC